MTVHETPNRPPLYVGRELKTLDIKNKLIKGFNLINYTLYADSATTRARFSCKLARAGLRDLGSATWAPRLGLRDLGSAQVSRGLGVGRGDLGSAQVGLF